MWTSIKNFLSGSSNQQQAAPSTVVDTYTEKLPDGDKYLGFENLSATICYANSATQMLFHTKPFRQHILRHKPIKEAKDSPKNKRTDASDANASINDQPDVNMLNELQNLFKSMETSRKSKGAFNHSQYVKAIKKGNCLFDNDEHHDSHEFVNWLLDDIHENCIKSYETRAENSPYGPRGSFISEFFEGKLQNKFMCLTCEKTNTRLESFYNLSIDIENNTSLAHCMRRFSVKELLNKGDKFYCEKCNAKQVATKEITVNKYPKLLLLHLKRFKIDPRTYQHQKLAFRIPYPEELRLESSEGVSTLYFLKGIVVHAGSGMMHGHYYSLVKSQGKWMKFDDTRVSIVEDNYIQIYYGAPPMSEHHDWPCAYMLLYESEEFLRDSDKAQQSSNK